MDPIAMVETLVIVAGVTWCLLREIGRPDLVAMTGFAAAIVLGLVDGEDVSRVFSNPAPLTIGAMFILSAALYRTGTIDRLAAWFEQLAGKSEKRGLCPPASTTRRW
jgi:di/tricarboxylate transporter